MKKAISKLISHKLICGITAGIIVAVAIIIIAFKMIPKVMVSNNQPIQDEISQEVAEAISENQETPLVTSRGNDEARTPAQDTIIEETKIEESKTEVSNTENENANKVEKESKTETEATKKETTKSTKNTKSKKTTKTTKSNKNTKKSNNDSKKKEEKKSDVKSEKNESESSEKKENKNEDTTNNISIKDVRISKGMNLTKRTGLSREDFIKLMAGVKQDTSGFFEKNAGTIYDLCQKYNINEIFFCGLISAESGWNIAKNHRSTHNYISLMRNGKLIKYGSVNEGLEVAAQKLHYNYLTPGGKFYHGKTLSGVQKCFCPSSSWISLVYGRMKQIV